MLYAPTPMTFTRTSLVLLGMMMMAGAAGALIGGPAAPAAAAEAMALAPDAAKAKGVPFGGKKRKRAGAEAAARVGSALALLLAFRLEWSDF